MMDPPYESPHVRTLSPGALMALGAATMLGGHMPSMDSGPQATNVDRDTYDPSAAARFRAERLARKKAAREKREGKA